MSTIHVRPSHTGVGGRASCPCGWAVTSTKKDAFNQAVNHNEVIHLGDKKISVSYTKGTQ